MQTPIRAALAVPCGVIEVDPGKTLVYTFADFELHWTIQPDGDCCIRRLEHRGFDLENPQHRFADENMPTVGAHSSCRAWQLEAAHMTPSAS
ncbi:MULTISPECIES: hypothetical protein [Ensifer]|uniref:Uncharacterized protein n=1 Tax=Ensifer adhaerens TaxID=106592 RepID=A0ABY8HQU6_ENSAD|nr:MULTISPECIES: hypothetical protein [Ensifer]WFP94178.1 hypothetical protein P4B07_23485 [Ensifer adhaerens]